MTAATFYVHYTVTKKPRGPQHCVAGPYTIDCVLGEKRDISTYAGISDVYISERATREEPAPRGLTLGEQAIRDSGGIPG